MSLDPITSFIVIIAAGATVFFTRAMAFLFFPDPQKTPTWVLYLGQVLPFSVMGLLIVYCLRHINLLLPPRGLPEVIAVLFVAFIHLWKRNSFISMASGTALYMFLVQKVF